MPSQDKKHWLSLALWICMFGSCVMGCAVMTGTPVTSTAEVMVTPSATATLTPLSSPIPTLDTVSAQQHVTKLFETNNGCRLPCWWGITPGKTTWEDALKILAPVSLKIEPYYPQRQTSSIYVKIISPTPDLFGQYLPQVYIVENNIVTAIDINSNYDLATFTYFKTFIHEYELPKQFYIRGYSEPYLDNWLFLLALYYPQQGMILEYSTKPTVVGNYLSMCWSDANSPILHLWNPEDTLTFEEVIDLVYPPGSIDLPPYKSIDDMGIDSKEFTKDLTDPVSSYCMKIPKKMISP